MAKRRRTHKRKTHSKSRTSLSAKPRRRKRRRMGAGDKMFKMVSDPLTGGAVGAVLGYIVQRGATKVVKGSNGVGLAAAGVLAFLTQKKAPFVCAGIVGGATAAATAGFVAKQPAGSFIQKLLGDDAHFVNDNLLSENRPIMLSADGDSVIPYNLKDELSNMLLSDYGQVNRGVGASMNTMDDSE